MPTCMYVYMSVFSSLAWPDSSLFNMVGREGFGRLKYIKLFKGDHWLGL